MDINDTLVKASEQFGIPVAVITRGGFRKGGNVTKAREWVVCQHPDAGCGELMRALNYASHRSIVRIRQKYSPH